MFAKNRVVIGLLRVAFRPASVLVDDEGKVVGIYVPLEQETVLARQVPPPLQRLLGNAPASSTGVSLWVGVLNSDPTKATCGAVPREAHARRPGTDECHFLFYVQHFESPGAKVLNQVCAMDLEGIVAKKKSAPFPACRAH